MAQRIKKEKKTNQLIKMIQKLNLFNDTQLITTVRLRTGEALAQEGVAGDRRDF
jgi:hypothetical protein